MANQIITDIFGVDDSPTFIEQEKERLEKLLQAGYFEGNETLYQELFCVYTKYESEIDA